MSAPALVLILQQKQNFRFSPAVENEQAGIAIYQSQSFNYQLLAGKKGDATVLILLVKTERDEVTVLKEEILDAPYPDLTLRITENEQDLTFAYSVRWQI